MRNDYTILGLLARGPATGYDLGKWLSDEGIFLGRKPSMSPIYRSLTDMTGDGWVTAETQPRDNAPDGKVYSLTETGRAALVAWANEPFVPAPRPMDPEFIVKLNFAGQLGIEYALPIIEAELVYRKQQRDAEGGPFHGGRAQHPIPEIDGTWLAFIEWITHERGYASTSLYISWLETVQRELTLIRSNGGIVSRLFDPEWNAGPGISGNASSTDSGSHGRVPGEDLKS